MKIRKSPYKCPLGALQPNAADAETVKRDGWLRQGILVVSKDEGSLDFIEKEIVRRIGDRLYGKSA